MQANGSNLIYDYVACLISFGREVSLGRNKSLCIQYCVVPSATNPYCLF